MGRYVPTTYYGYDELAAKALATGAAEDLAALGEWFQQHGSRFWNGEYYEIDSSNRLFPVYEENADGNFELIGWELR